LAGALYSYQSQCLGILHVQHTETELRQHTMRSDGSSTSCVLHYKDISYRRRGKHMQEDEEENTCEQSGPKISSSPIGTNVSEVA